MTLRRMQRSALLHHPLLLALHPSRRRARHCCCRTIIWQTPRRFSGVETSSCSCSCSCSSSMAGPQMQIKLRQTFAVLWYYNGFPLLYIEEQDDSTIQILHPRRTHLTQASHLLASSPRRVAVFACHLSSSRCHQSLRPLRTHVHGARSTPFPVGSPHLRSLFLLLLLSGRMKILKACCLTEFKLSTEAEKLWRNPSSTDSYSLLMSSMMAWRLSETKR